MTTMRSLQGKAILTSAASVWLQTSSIYHKMFWKTAFVISELYKFLFATTTLCFWRNTGCYMYTYYVSWSKTNIDLFSRLLWTTFFKQLNGNQAEKFTDVCPTSPIPINTLFSRQNMKAKRALAHSLVQLPHISYSCHCGLTDSLIGEGRLVTPHIPLPHTPLPPPQTSTCHPLPQSCQDSNTVCIC